MSFLLRIYNAIYVWCGYVDFLGINYLVAKLRGKSVSRSHLDGSGDIIWYCNGKIHREDGPAIERVGSNSWYINGELHRLDGPAIQYKNKSFFMSDRDITIEDAGEWYVYGKKVKPEDIKKMYDILVVANKLIDAFQQKCEFRDIFNSPEWEHVETF